MHERDEAGPGFRAFRIHRDADPFRAGIERVAHVPPAPGEVVLEVHHSSVNYKDALAGTNRGRILRAPVLTGGIDVAGTVVESACEGWSVGDAAFACGAGLSETIDGGYAERARLPGAALLRPLPGLALRECMAIGTAGITAAIALRRLEDVGQPTDRGPTLAWLLATVRPWGNVASIGLAGGHEFGSSVMPLILRGASLIGANCMELPRAMLEDCWARLAGPWRPTMLERITSHVATLDTLPESFDALIESRRTGRTVVDIAPR